MSDASSLPAGTLLAGKFRIERLLGAGAMGAVYAIQHELTRHRRALKLLHADVRVVPELVHRFLNEASAAGRAGNPHLVETFDAGTLPSGEPYVVMELLEGQALSALLARQGVLELDAAAEFVAQAAEGIEAAHRAGIIHRDLKPDNLFIAERDGAPFVKILDFGVSKFATESGARLSVTRAGVIYGSPAYMSPEQLTGRVDIDPRTDVFALGVVLYQCLTGKLPFDAPTLEALSLRILMGDCAPAEVARPELPPAFAAVVSRALASNRDERFPSARALSEALAPFRSAGKALPAPAPGVVQTGHSGVSPLSPAPARKGWRWALAAAGLGLVALLGLARLHEPRIVSTGPAVVSAVSASLAPPSPDASATAKRASASAELFAATVEPAPSVVVPRSQPAKPAIRQESSRAAEPRTAPAPAAASAPPSTAKSLGLQDGNPFR